MAKKYLGTNNYHLPARQIEPYRLWFEFLCLAHQDPEVEVDYKYYSEWDDFYNCSFNDWWTEARWTHLFGSDIGLRILKSGSIVAEEEIGISIRLPLNKDPKKILEEISLLLVEREAGVSFQNSEPNKFSLSEGYELAFLKYLPKVRVMLKIYGLWLRHMHLNKRGRIRQTAVDYYDWASKRNDWITSNNYKLTKPDIPFAIGNYAKTVKFGAVASEDDRRAFMRYLQKGRRLAKNAAGGVFPGRY